MSKMMYTMMGVIASLHVHTMEEGGSILAILVSTY